MHRSADAVMSCERCGESEALSYPDGRNYCSIFCAVRGPIPKRLHALATTPRRVIVAMFGTAILPTLAVAQAPQPITLTPQEYNEVMGALVSRDPVMALLVQKQNAAQQAAAAKVAEAKPEEKK